MSSSAFLRAKVGIDFAEKYKDAPEVREMLNRCDAVPGEGSEQLQAFLREWDENA
jgi:hypothetical protein